MTIKAAIRVEKGDAGATGKSFVLGPSEYTIGRSPGGWVQLIRENISRHQLFFSYNQETDRHSITNRSDKVLVRVADAELSVDQSVELADGVSIEFGGIQLIYLQEAPPDAAPDARTRDMSQADKDTIP